MRAKLKSQNGDKMNHHSPKRKKRDRGVKRGVALLPNLLTTANMFCGFFSILQSFSGKYTTAVWFIILASFFDFLDGRVARMTGTSSDFGVAYDSLADLCTVCLAPALLAYQWGLKSYGKLGIGIAFLYFCCGALRLARFNVQAGDVEKTDFQGLPSPAAAGTLVSYTLFHKYFAAQIAFPSGLLVGLTIFLALLMVSHVRYKSAKSAQQRTNFIFLIGAVGLIAWIATQPQVSLFAFGICYVLFGFVSWIVKSPRKFYDLKGQVLWLYSDLSHEVEAKPHAHPIKGKGAQLLALKNQSSSEKEFH